MRTQTPQKIRGGKREAVEVRHCWRTERNQSASARTVAVGTIYQYLNKQDLIHGRGREGRSTPRPDRVDAKAMP